MFRKRMISSKQQVRASFLLLFIYLPPSSFSPYHFYILLFFSKTLELLINNINSSMLQSKSLQQQMLKNYIQTIFNKYDTDRSGTLDVHEMTFFFNDLFKALQIPIVVTQTQSLQAIKSIDANNDGAVNKEELFAAFKKMLNQPQQNQGVNMQGNGQGYGYNQGYNNNQYNGYGNNQPYNQGYNPQYPNQYHPQYGYQPQGAQIYYNSQQPQYPNQYNPNPNYMNNSMGRPNVNQGYVNPQMQQTQPYNQQVPPQYNNNYSSQNNYNPYR